MALRIRDNGDIFCAALTEEEFGDNYIHDGLSYILTVQKRFIVTMPEPYHTESGGQWWWKDDVPEGVEIEVW